MASRYRKGGDGGLVIVVLVLFAVLGGLVYAFWDKIKGLGEKPKVAVERPRPRPKPKPKVAKPAPRPKPVVSRPPAHRPPPRVSLSASKLAKARDAHRRGEEALKALDFDLAARLFREEASFLSRDRNAAARAGGFRTKALTFAKLTGDIKPNPEAAGDMVTFIMHSGTRMTDVTIIDERPDAYVIARKGMTGEIPRNLVATVQRASAEEQRGRLLDRFRKAEERTSTDSGAACFELAELALKDRLNDKAIHYLEKAYAADGENLPKAIRVGRAKMELRRIIWYADTGRTNVGEILCSKVERLYADLPEIVAEARELRERMARPVAANYESTVKIRTVSAPGSSSGKGATSIAREKVTVEADTVTSGSGRNAALMQEINKLFKEGMDEYVAGRPGNPNSNMHLKKAAALFDRVVDLCDKALRNDPNNSQIESRQADASRCRYHARKMMTL